MVKHDELINKEMNRLIQENKEFKDKYLVLRQVAGELVNGDFKIEETGVLVDEEVFFTLKSILKD